MGGRSAPKVKYYDVMTPGQLTTSRDFANLLSGLAGGAERYPGTLVPPISSMMTSALSSLGQWAGSPGGLYGQQEDALTRALSGRPSTDVSPEFFRDYFESAVKPGMAREYEEGAVETGKQFVGPGTYWGGARAEAERRGGRDYLDRLAATRGGLEMGGLNLRAQLSEGAAGRALQAVPLATDLGWEPARRATAAWGMGKEAWDIDMQRAVAEMGEWLRTRPEYGPYFQNALAYLGTPLIGASTYQPTNIGASMAGGAAGAGMSGLMNLMTRSPQTPVMGTAGATGTGTFANWNPPSGKGK